MNEQTAAVKDLLGQMSKSKTFDSVRIAKEIKNLVEVEQNRLKEQARLKNKPAQS